MTAVTPDLIFQVANGFMAAKHLFVANEVGLFAALADSAATLDEVAQRIGVPRRTLRILADAMVALGLLERQGDKYQNTPTTFTFLSGHTPADLRPALRYWNRLNYQRWARLEEVVRAEQPVFGATLFDLPAVSGLARQRLAGESLATRLHIVEGNFFTDPLPTDCDAILIANVFHNFLPERNRALLRQAGTFAPAGTRLLLVDFWTDPTHTQPLTAALMAGAFLLVSGEGDVYSAEEVHDWLQATGWRLLERKPLAGPSSLIVAEKAGA